MMLEFEFVSHVMDYFADSAPTQTNTKCIWAMISTIINMVEWLNKIQAI